LSKIEHKLDVLLHDDDNLKDDND